MNILTRLKIGQRLLAGFASVLVLAVIVGAFSVSRLAQVNANTTDLATNWLPATRLLGDFKTQVSILRRAEASTLLSGGKAEVVAAQTRRVADVKARAAEDWKNYLATIELPDERAIAAEVEGARDRYYAALDKSFASDFAAADAHDRIVTAYEGESKASFDAMFAAINRDVEYQSKGADIAYKASQDTYSSARIAVRCPL